MQYVLSLSINSASGTCTAVSVAAGKTTLYAASETISGLSGSPGAIELPFIQTPTTYTGPAVVVGKFTCNGQTGTAKAPLFFY